MSKRENIANDIISKLDAVSSPIEFKKITREPFEVEELADAQFPALFIQSGDETRQPASIGATGSGIYEGTIDFVIIAFGKGTNANIDTVRNQIIEVIEETLDTDVTRDGNAIDTQIIETATDEGTIYPYGGVRVTVRVIYQFTRGSA
tara:strand:+ start:9304 stop:9747 length:444 start_codon:yes stop_codon:yes gene_type:complete